MPQYKLNLALSLGDHTIEVRATDASPQPLTSTPISARVTVQTASATRVAAYTKQRPFVDWRIALFSRGGAPLGIIDDCQQPKLGFALNGIDQFGFALPLDHRLASVIDAGATVVKVWRTVLGETLDPRFPSFAGTVMPLGEGSGNISNYTAYSPFQVLQARYVWDPLVYASKKGRATIDQSEILHRLLDYTNSRGQTGIVWGSAPATALRPRKYDIGQNIWEAFIDIVTSLGGVDLVPLYLHLGDANLMELSTTTARGNFQPNARIDYFVGRKNASDMTRQFTIEPNQFATLIGVRGQGDKPVTAISFDDAAIAEFGLWERYEQADNAQTFELVKAISDGLLAQSRLPLETVQPVIGVGTSPFYGRDYRVGDVIPVAARRGRMRVDRYLRVYTAELERTDNLQEQVSLQIAEDFDHIIPTP